MTALEAMKSVRRLESLVLFLDNPNAKKVLAAWTLYRTQCKDRPLQPNETPDQAYWTLWLESAEVEYPVLAETAGVPLNACVSLFDRLKQARQIFPDGTITQDAMAILQAEVRTQVQSVLPRGYRPAPANEPQRPNAIGTRSDKPHRNRLPPRRSSRSK